MVNNDQTPIVVAGASVLTMDPLIEDLSSGDVLIEAGTIGAVGAQVEVPNGATVIDATGMIVLPGLVDRASSRVTVTIILSPSSTTRGLTV